MGVLTVQAQQPEPAVAHRLDVYDGGAAAGVLPRPPQDLAHVVGVVQPVLLAVPHHVRTCCRAPPEVHAVERPLDLPAAVTRVHRFCAHPTTMPGAPAVSTAVRTAPGTSSWTCLCPTRSGACSASRRPHAGSKLTVTTTCQGHRVDTDAPHEQLLADALLAGPRGRRLLFELVDEAGTGSGQQWAHLAARSEGVAPLPQQLLEQLAQRLREAVAAVDLDALGLRRVR